jgi:wee1-like protein kinase
LSADSPPRRGPPPTNQNPFSPAPASMKQEIGVGAGESLLPQLSDSQMAIGYGGGMEMDIGLNPLKRSDSSAGMNMIGSSPDTYNSGPPPTPAKNTHSRTGGSSSPSPGPDVASKPSRFEEDFEQLAVLGKGSFGTCYKCVKRLDGCVYAVKRTNRRIRGDIDRNHVLKEVYAVRRCTL